MPKSREKGQTVRLGLLPPLTGLVGIYGQEIVTAAEIACQEINEAGGVLGKPVELIVEDDGSLPEFAVPAAQKLVDHHQCSAIIGNLLSNSRIAVAYRVAEPCRIPHLNFSFYEGGIINRYFFNFAALPNQQIEAMIPVMKDTFGGKMFFAGNNYEWPRGSIDAAKRMVLGLGGQVMGEVYLPIGVDPDEIENLLEEVEGSGAEVFVPYFAGLDQIELLTRFTNRGLKEKMGVVMGHYDEIMASQLPAHVREGFFSCNSYFMTVNTPENRDYLNRLSARPEFGGVWPQGKGILTNFGEGTYLCVKAFAAAANKAGSLDAEALVDELETVSISAPQGNVQMDPETHHAKVNTFLSRCENDGTFTIVEKFGARDPVIPERYRHMGTNAKVTHDEDIRIAARILDYMTEGVALISVEDGSIIYANPGSEQMFEFKRGELKGQRLESLYASTDRSGEEIAREINRILYKSGVWEGDTEYINRTGGAFWCSVSISAFTHAEYGEVWMAVQKDITQQKRAEEELRASQRLLQTVFDALPVQVFVKDTQQKYLMVNRRVLDDTGLTIEDFQGRHILETSYGTMEQRNLFLETDRQVLKSGEPLDMREHKYTTNDGDNRIQHVAKVPIKDEEGNVVGVLGVTEDITERKQAEEKLRESEERLRSFMDSAPDNLTLYDAQMNVVDTNPNGLARFGLPREKVIGRNLADLVPEAVEAGRIGQYLEVIKTGVPTQLRSKTHHPLHGKREMEVRAFPVGSGLGAIATDVTERVQAEVTKDEFISTLSHELRTPLTSIMGAIGLISGMYAEELPEQVVELLAISQRNIDHLVRLIGDLLDLQKIESGKLEFNPRPIEVRELLLHAISVNRGYAARFEVTLRALEFSEGARIMGDWNLLTQVLSNLISNAVKFSDADSEVTIGCVRRQSELRVSVSDKGTGIPKHFRSKIFQKFSQADSSDTRKVGGTGLGLNICKSIIEVHGGNIDYESEDYQGSTFFFDLPLLPSASSQA